MRNGEDRKMVVSRNEQEFLALFEKLGGIWPSTVISDQGLGR